MLCEPVSRYSSSAIRMTRGSLVEENETFTSLLDTWHPDYSFRNYGIGGYGRANSIRIYEDKGAETVAHKLVVQAVSLQHRP